MEETRQLVASYVRAGYRKIHLDASFICADDPTPLPETVRKAITWFRENGYLPQVKGEAN